MTLLYRRNPFVVNSGHELTVPSCVVTVRDDRQWIQMLLNDDGRQPSAAELVAGLERCSFEALLPLMPRITDVVLKVGRGRARARARAAHIPPHPPSLAGVCVV